MASSKTYRGKEITRLSPSGYYEFYSDEQGRFLKFDDLEDAKAQIDSELKSTEKSSPSYEKGKVRKGNVLLEGIDFAVDTALSWDGTFPKVDKGDYIVLIEDPATTSPLPSSSRAATRRPWTPTRRRRSRWTPGANAKATEAPRTAPTSSASPASTPS